MGHFFPQKQLVGLKLGDAPLVCGDHRGAISIDDPVEKLFDLAVNFTQLFFDHFARLFGVQSLAVPRIAERSRRQLDELLGRRDRLQHFLERIFDLGTRIGFAAHITFPLPAQIIGIGSAHTALAPIRRERMTAGRTAHMPAQRKIAADIRAGSAARLALQAILNRVEDFDGDKRLVLAEAWREIPRRNMDDACIERVRQNLFHALVRDFAIAHLRHRRLRFEKPHHFGLAGKAPARVAFKGFLYDRGQRLIAHKDFTAARPTSIFVAPYRLEDPEALLHP